MGLSFADAGEGGCYCIRIGRGMRSEDQDLPPEEVEEQQAMALSSEMERAAAIASVLRHQAERKEAREAVQLPGRRPLLPQLTALALSTVVAVYVWFGSPSWLEPRLPPPPPLEVEETSVQAAVYIQAQQIEAYRVRNGRLPAFLEEAGPAVAGVRYTRLDARTYRIQGHDQRVAFSYTSGEPMDSLAAAVERVLMGGDE